MTGAWFSASRDQLTLADEGMVSMEQYGPGLAPGMHSLISCALKIATAAWGMGRLAHGYRPVCKYVSAGPKGLVYRFQLQSNMHG